MKPSNRFAILAAVFLCFTLITFQNVSFASEKTGHTTLTSKKSSKLHSARQQNIKNKKAVKGKKALHAHKSKSRGNTVNSAYNDREIWQKRARESEIFTGKASWYGRDFHNKATASGIDYDMYTFTAAHRTLPIGTVVKVTEQRNGKSVMVCVTDRGPYSRNRIIDLSFAAARKLDLENRGVGNVKLEIVSDEHGAPLQPNKAYFIHYASDNGRKKVGPYTAYADAAAMHEALRQAHPEAEVVLENSARR